MKLNCDMGESYGNWTIGLDSEVMPWIDMANIACGFHASDPDVMANTIQLAKQHQVEIGAHPGYNDKQGFGRRSIPHSFDQIKNLVAYQIGAMQSMCALQQCQLEYVKPHGALYNDMMDSLEVFEAIVEAVALTMDDPKLMLLATSDAQPYQSIAQQHQVELIFEAFADRAYTAQGKLVPRTQEGAVLHDSSAIIQQVVSLATFGSIRAIDGSVLALEVDTICVHGDNAESVQSVKAIKAAIS
ncbi:5-oxoprolinase subunit PxpA [Alginatibacterium sediminis]|uniref:5-oxoprolinase subunit PxpA n=1 Tax=Alginatibacterium sediminis TaxID=2164068 RepID=A0A420EBP9_9ALTE|nr:5-oxoprolinase subunit PxpA [Alginatibacterium sediminis]RKF18084.1 5-oxoprolinase subunit PxpA [Alginatibacterium sediminis]